MRILSVGAFPFPYPQGSQVFAAQQARALAGQGAEVTLLTYGGAHREEAAAEIGPDVTWIGSSRAFAPRRRRSGPSLSKPLADAALVRSIVRAQRRQGFDIVLAHNAEAAFAAACARALAGVPFVYVAHTLFAQELPRYSQGGLLQRPLAWAGKRIDSFATRLADGVLVLSRAAEAALRGHARGPLRVLPPGLAPRDPPSDAERSAACKRHDVEPGAFVLYAGNLDGYQGLEVLAEAAPRFSAAGWPLVIATHDDEMRGPCAEVLRPRIRRVTSFDELRALSFAAGALLAPRQVRGGFPIKQLNYMETGRPIVTRQGMVDSLDERSAVLLPAAAAAEDFAAAVEALVSDPTRAAALGRAAAEGLRTQHDWAPIARATLELADAASDSGQDSVGKGKGKGTT